MPQFETPEDATAKLGGVFQDAVTDETLYRGFQQLNAVVRLQLKDPSAQITVKAKKGEPGAVDFGPSKLNPDVIVRMDADTAHGWLSGEVNPTVALSKGLMRATGPVDAILRLVPVAPALAEQYKAVVANGGRVTEEPVLETAPEPEAAPEVSEAAEADGVPAQSAEPPSAEEQAPAVAEVVAEAPVAEDVVADAPEAPAPTEDAEPAVAEAPQGEPEVVDAVGAEEPAAAAEEPPAEAPAVAAEPAAEEPVVVEEPAVAAEPAAEAAQDQPTEKPAEDRPAGDAPAAGETPGT